VVALLADGKQSKAEVEIDSLLTAQPEAAPLVFFKGACLRSRFQVGEAVGPLLRTIKTAPSSAEALAAAFILGIDFSANTETALAYLSGLAAVQRDYPGSYPIQWMCAVMARSLTAEKSRYVPTGQRNGLLSFGVRQYDDLLKRSAPLPGPVLVHQSYANILDSLQSFDEALVHRKIALSMERRPWAIDGMADTLRCLARFDEALQFADEALAVCIRDYEERLANPVPDSASASGAFNPDVTEINAQQEELLANYHSRRGSILYEAGNIAEGAAALLEAFVHRPTDPSLVHFAAKVPVPWMPLSPECLCVSHQGAATALDSRQFLNQRREGSLAASSAPRRRDDPYRAPIFLSTRSARPSKRIEPPARSDRKSQRPRQHLRNVFLTST